jgi:23S rRNA (pseudouridine1915-N3)-methyltransferase
MYKLKILSVGKTKEKWLSEAFAEYAKRLSHSIEIDCLWTKNSNQLLEWSLKEATLLCLDPLGQLLDSYQFADRLMSRLEEGGSRLTIVIGGAEGLPSELKKKELISLSPLTFTHQISRLILIEQIYRAFEIKKGSTYHK